MRRWVENVGDFAGHFLANFTAVLVTLLVYTLAAIVTYFIVLQTVNPEVSEAFRITYAVATGGDPYDFANQLSPHPWLWNWILIFHVISWLIVPVLAATAVDAAYRVVERRRHQAELALRRRLRRIGLAAGVSEEDLEKALEQSYTDVVPPP